MIKIKNISVAYDSKTIIQNLSLNIGSGKIISLLGPNGSGKSTLIKTLARVNTLKNGEIFVDDYNIVKESSKKISKKIAFLPQNLSNHTEVTVYDLVCFGRFPYRSSFGSLSKADYEKVEYALKELNLWEIKDKYVNSLSGGQKQRAWIAMVLAQDTPYILLDEPTSYLDINYQLEVLNIIKKLNKENKTIIFSHHDINQAAYYSDEVLVMKDGQLVDFGSTKKVITNEMLNKVFGVEANISHTSDGKVTCNNFKSLKLN